MTDLVGTFVSGDDVGLCIALDTANLPTDDLAEPGRLFLRFDAEDGPIGYGGLERLGQHALLRSLVVLPKARGHGHGRAITERLLVLAADGGPERVWLLTTTAGAFFEDLGFVRAERHDAPAIVLATRQASTICGAAPLLTRALGGPRAA